jgi:hypothetical protein
MSKTVSEDDAIAPEHGADFPRTDPSLSEVHRSVKVPKGAEIVWEFFACCSPSPARIFWLQQSASRIRELGHRPWPRVAPFYYTLLSVGIISEAHGHLSDQSNHHTR